MKNDSLQALMRPNTDQDEGHFHLGYLLDTLRDNLKLITMMTVITMLIGIGYVLVARPVYQSDIMIQVEDNPNSPNNLLASVSSMFDVKSAAADEAEIVSSRLVVSRAVETMKLYIQVTPKYFPVVGRSIASHRVGLSVPGLFGFGGYVWGSERVDIADFDVPSALYGESFELTALPHGAFRLRLATAGIDAIGRTGVPMHLSTSAGPMYLMVRSIDANPGATFVLARLSSIAATESLQRDLRISQTSKDSGIIHVGLDGYDPDQTRRTLTEIGRQYVKQNIDRKSEEARKSIQFLDEQLPVLKRQLEQAEGAFNAFRMSNSTVNLSEESSAILQQTVEAENRLVELRQKYDDASARFTENHPAVISIANQIAPIRARLAELEASTKRMPQVEQDEVRLQRDMEVSRDLYTNMLNTAQQLRLVQASKTGNAGLVDAAVTAELPVKPNRKLVVGLSGLLGLLLGGMTAAARKELFGRLVDPHEIEQSIGLSVYAAVPHSKKQELLSQRIAAKEEGVFVLASVNADDPSVEALRSFRTALQFSLLEARSNIILIAGCTANVGKSFVSANFATVVAMSKQRVLLVDGDLRKGHLHRYFGQDQSPGLSDTIANNVSVDAAVRRNVLPNLDFFPCGALPPNPSELLAHANLRRVIESLNDRYDLVIVDSPPILAVSDAIELARMAACAFLVVRQDVSFLAEVKESIKRLEQVGIVPRGVVFNAMRYRPGTYGYGGGRYRYSKYAYGSYVDSQ